MDSSQLCQTRYLLGRRQFDQPYVPTDRNGRSSSPIMAWVSGMNHDQDQLRSEFHTAQVRSLCGVAALSMKWPASQGARMGWHTSPLSVAEKVVPRTHGAHCRSALEDPAMDMPCPAGHVRHAVHDLRAAVSVNVPSEHAAQTRLLDAVATARV